MGLLKRLFLLACLSFALAACNAVQPGPPGTATLPSDRHSATPIPEATVSTTPTTPLLPTFTPSSLSTFIPWPSSTPTPFILHESDVTEGAFPTEEVFATLPPSTWGIKILLVYEGRLFIWEKGQRRLLYEAPERTQPRLPSFSSDGSRVAFILSNELWLVNTDGSGARKLLSTDALEKIGKIYENPPSQGYHVWKYAWRADGRVILFTTGSNGQPIPYPLYDLSQVDVRSGEIKTLLPAGEGGLPFSSPDGLKIIILTDKRVGAVNSDSSNSRWILDFDPILTYSEFIKFLSPVWSVDSRSFVIAVPPPDQWKQPDVPLKVWKVPVNGPSPLVAAELLIPYQDLFISPDGKNIIYYNTNIRGSQSGSPYNPTVLLRSLESGVEKDIGPAGSNQGCWSKDGRFALMRGENKDYLLDVRSGSVTEFWMMDAESFFCLDGNFYFALLHSGNQYLLRLVSMDGDVYDLGPITGRDFDFLTTNP